jgi:hypothetical protein
MLRATIWRDLRWRLLAAAILVMPLAALLSWSYAARVRAREAVYTDYLAYLDDGWFQLPGPSASFLLVAVILGAGSTLVRPRDQVAYLLALPLTRRRLLFTHIGSALSALAAVILLTDVVHAAGAWSAGVSFPAAGVLLRSVGVLAAAVPWVCVTTAVVSVVRYPVLAMTLMLGAAAVLPADRFRLEIPPTPSTSTLAPWDAWAFADPRAWHGAVPIASLLVAAALTGLAVLLASYRMERFEP